MQAYLEQDNDIVFDSSCLFDIEPAIELENQLHQQFIINVNIPMSKSFLDKKKAIKHELSKIFNDMRNKQSMKFSDRISIEEQGMYELISRTIINVGQKIKNNDNFSDEDTAGLKILDRFMFDMEELRKERVTIEDVLNFLKSDYYKSIPYNIVESKLYASMLSQSGHVSPTDVFDYKQACQMLPFSCYYLTDHSFKHRLTTTPLKLDKEFNIRVYSMREIALLIKELLN
jgi:hypothetical protein